MKKWNNPFHFDILGWGSYLENADQPQVCKRT